MNTGSLKHVTKTLKNAVKNPRPSGDLIPRNMQSRHVPEEPQQPSCEIKGGDQEMAAMMLILKNFNNGCKFFSINIIAAISWLPRLFFFTQAFKATPFFHSLAVFVWIHNL